MGGSEGEAVHPRGRAALVGRCAAPLGILQTRVQGSRAVLGLNEIESCFLVLRYDTEYVAYRLQNGAVRSQCMTRVIRGVRQKDG